MVAAVSPRWGSVSPDLARVNFYFTKCFLGFVFGRFVRRVCARHGARLGDMNVIVASAERPDGNDEPRPARATRRHARRDSRAPGSAVARPLALAARRASSPVRSNVLYIRSHLPLMQLYYKYTNFTGTF